MNHTAANDEVCELFEMAAENANRKLSLTVNLNGKSIECWYKMSHDAFDQDNTKNQRKCKVRRDAGDSEELLGKVLEVFHDITMQKNALKEVKLESGCRKETYGRYPVGKAVKIRKRGEPETGDTDEEGDKQGQKHES